MLMRRCTFTRESKRLDSFKNRHDIKSWRRFGESGSIDPTIISKQLQGCKQDKERITLVLCCNAVSKMLAKKPLLRISRKWKGMDDVTSTTIRSCWRHCSICYADEYREDVVCSGDVESIAQEQKSYSPKSARVVRGALQLFIRILCGL